MIMLFFWLIKGTICVTGKCGRSICFVLGLRFASQAISVWVSGALSHGLGLQ